MVYQQAISLKNCNNGATHGDIDGVRSAGLGAGGDLLGAGAATNELRG